MSTLRVECTEPAVAALYEQYSSRIFGYCLRRLPSREEAEDAVQQTFMNAFRGLRSGVVPRSDAAWLFKIAENVCRERRRSAWRRNRLELVQDPEDLAGLAAAPVRSHDELAGVADALAELTPNQQRALLMREWQGLSYKEIAAQLELTESAVETLLFRARRSLARKLDRSRGRHWGLDVGSLTTWGKSLFGGAAAKLDATAAVVAKVEAATPAVRHALVPATAPRHQQPAQHSAATRPASPSAVTSPRGGPAKPVRKTGRPSAPTKGPTPGTDAVRRPEEPPASAPTTATAPPPPPPPAAASSPPPPPPPALPTVSAPPPPALPVQTPPTPPPPPLPTVTTPTLPTVQTPTLPKLP